MRPVQSWGRLAAPLHDVAEPQNIAEAQRLVAQGPNWLPRGMGRSYGDVADNEGGRLIDTGRLDRFIAFDRQAGVIEAEAGVTLADIIQVTLPHGWFLPTTPGTKFVTLGGAIANDIHGKNHYSAGTFGSWVESMVLLRSDGNLHRCSADVSPDLFRATIGGLGLTGLITQARLQLAKVGSAFLHSEDVVFSNVDEFFSLSKESDRTGWEHTVAWMDCMGGAAGRGIFSRANWCNDGVLDPELDRNALSVPFQPPFSFVNSASVRAFNALYFHTKALRAGKSRIHYNTAFYPLDGIQNWNRMYGLRGFYQYQCVIPASNSPDAVRELIRELSRSGQASFLVVIKTFGERKSPGLLSFPEAGTNFAVDIPNRGEISEALFRKMDEIVAAARGRIYPAKDARMPPKLFREGYPAYAALAALKDERVNSDFWNRVMGA